MKTLRTIARLVFGVTFILSGFLKFMDPVGTSLIVKEYLAVFHIGFLESAALWIGIALSTAEFTLGASVILGMRMKLMSTISMAFISFFTILTLYLAIFNPIEDCGCFGQAVHLTNWQTFGKNIVLLLCAIVFFLQRKKVFSIAPDAVEWVIVALFAFFALGVSLHSYYTLPYHDFTAYKVGTDLNDLESGAAQYSTTFIYSKDGEEKEFTLDNLPDDSWTYVDSKTELIEGSTDMAQIDLALSDEDGNYYTEELLSQDILAVAVIWDPESITSAHSKNINSFFDNAALNGVSTALFCVGGDYDDNVPAYIADRKALMTLNRSNGGFVLFHKGMIIGKWPNFKASKIDFKDYTDDYEIELLKKDVAESIKFSFTLIGIFIALLVIRYVCRMSFKREKQ